MKAFSNWGRYKGDSWKITISLKGNIRLPFLNTFLYTKTPFFLFKKQLCWCTPRVEVWLHQILQHNNNQFHKLESDLRTHLETHEHNPVMLLDQNWHSRLNGIIKTLKWVCYQLVLAKVDQCLLYAIKFQLSNWLLKIHLNTLRPKPKVLLFTTRVYTKKVTWYLERKVVPSKLMVRAWH